MKKICKMHKAEHGHKACDLHKARVDEGLAPNDKAYQRAERNNRTSTTTVTREPGAVGKFFGKKPEVSTDVRHGGAGSKMGTAYSPGYQASGSDGVTVGKKVVGKPARSMRKACEMHKTEFLKHACSLHKSEDTAPPHEGHVNEDERDGCPYCQDLDAVENAEGTAGMDDCPYCQELDGGANTETDDCPYCQEMDSEQGTSTEDDCPYCDDMAIEQADPAEAEIGGNTQTQSCNCPNCPPDNNHLSPDQQGISADDANPSTNGPDDCPECQQLYGDAVEEQPGQTGQEPPQTQGHETAEEVLDMLDQEPGQGEPPAEEAKQIDNTEMPQGDQMEDGTAVTDNFGQAQANDVSDADKQFQGEEQDQPDMASVMQGGLDDHAQEQKKAEVIDMVAQTLQGFKSNKEFLETTKEQNPGLYQSTIQMLKAMISLCELLGLQPKMPEQAAPEMPQEQAPPAAPSQSASPPQAAPSGGAAEPPKT